MSESYEKRGVSAQKTDVRRAIAGIDKGLFPSAFCKILPDVWGGDADCVNLLHADTAGTKPVLAYLYWKETGDLSAFSGLAQDALVMNLDDLACAGVTDNFVCAGTLSRNKHLIPGEVVAEIIQSAEAFAENLRGMGVNIQMAGGETADVGDVVRTLDVGYTVAARIKRKQVVDNKIKPGALIIGLSSFGQASYETAPNSGIGCNGLTGARHDLLSRYYAETHPESAAPEIPEELCYAGRFRLSDLPEGADMNVGQMLLSPTRTYLPVIRAVLENYGGDVQGLVHCTGGGHTKCLQFTKGLRVVKDNLFDPPPVFRFVEANGTTDAYEMYQTFNMGCRLEVYASETATPKIVAIAEEFGLEARVIGRTEAGGGAPGLTIIKNGKTFAYNA